jgi:hypothetical protein
VLPALELITTLAIEEAGEEGDHTLHEEPSTIRRYLRAARAHHMLPILEWSLDPPQLPGHKICATDAATINAVSRYLSRLVGRHGLPQKLLVVHRFTDEMVESEDQWSAILASPSCSTSTASALAPTRSRSSSWREVVGRPSPASSSSTNRTST